LYDGLNVLQAFNKVWHDGLIYKIKNSFPSDLYAIIKSYLLHRIFIVKYEEVITQLEENSGIPQDRIFESVFYLLYIADLSVALEAITVIYG